VEFVRPGHRLTDLPLTAAGERQALAVGDRLKLSTSLMYFRVSYSVQGETCELSGYGSIAELDRALIEWNYGEYEGKKRDWILT
jgi:broad specificity phosphatase PhoE